MLDKTLAYLEYASTGRVEENATSFALRDAAMEEVKLLRSLPEIILLGGSARFKQAFEDEAFRLALAGNIVLGKHVFKPGHEWPLSEGDKDLIHALQFRMCDLATRLHVMNVDGYVGIDTYNLIKFALRRELPVTFAHEAVQLHGTGQLVTTHHFMQATRRTVEFEQATLT